MEPVAKVVGRDALGGGADREERHHGAHRLRERDVPGGDPGPPAVVLEDDPRLVPVALEERDVTHHVVEPSGARSENHHFVERTARQHVRERLFGIGALRVFVPYDLGLGEVAKGFRRSGVEIADDGVGIESVLAGHVRPAVRADEQGGARDGPLERLAARRKPIGKYDGVRHVWGGLPPRIVVGLAD
jgi:hypothetical protein